VSYWSPALPTTYGGVYAVHWYRADQGTWQDDGVTPASADGNPVGRWDDIILGDHISQSTAADKPLLIPNAVNGEHALLWGESDYLRGVFTNGGTLSPPYTIFVVAQLSALENYNYLLSSSYTGDYRFSLFTYDPIGVAPLSWRVSDTEGYIGGNETSYVAATTGWGVFTVVCDAPNSGLWYNGEVAGENDTDFGATDLEGLTVGSDYLFQNLTSWEGYIAEILVYADALTSVDIDQVLIYLRDRYALDDCVLLNGNTLTLSRPVLGTPTLTSIGTEYLEASDLVTGTPVLGTPMGEWTPGEGTTEGGLFPYIWVNADQGVEFHWDATDGEVYGWYNQVDNPGEPNNFFYQATLSSCPKLVEDVIKGRPVLRSASNDTLWNPWNDISFSGDIPVTIFAVVANVVQNGPIFTIGRYSPTLMSVGTSPSSPNYPYVNFGNGWVRYDGDLDDWSGAHIAMWQREAGDLHGETRYFQDGVEAGIYDSYYPTRGPVVFSNTYPGYDVLIFSGPNITGRVYSHIDIGEIIVYKSTLSTADRSQVISYLSKRYLTLTFDCEASDLITGAPVLGTPTMYRDEPETDDLLTGAVTLGTPVLYTPQLYVGGVDRTGILVSTERTDEYCNPGVRVKLTFSEEFAITMWGDVSVYEWGYKKFTGTISRVESFRGEDRQFVIYAKDDIRRLREYFVVEDYTSSGEGIQYWISFFADQAGCGPITYTDSDANPNTLEGMTMGKMFAYEIIDELLLYAALDIWCDENNTLYVGSRMENTLTGSIAAGDNLSSIDRSRDSEPCRNAAYVYTVIGPAYASRSYDWQIDSGDLRTMVVSSIYINTIEAGEDLARRMVETAGPEHDIKRTILDGIEPTMEVGDYVTYDDGDENSGTGHVTSVVARVAGSGSVYEKHVTLDERCPKVGAGGLVPPDGRDVTVATYDFGVWRCKDIWASNPHWEPMNTGLTSTLYYEGQNMGGTLNCDWFIRDPYIPSGMAFLLTKSGILRTTSLEPGYENWVPVFMNSFTGVFFGDLASNWNRWRVTKIRSTIACEGKYFIAAARLGGPWNTWYSSYVGMTTKRFADFSSCSGVNGPGIYTYTPGADQCSSQATYDTCQLWGNHYNLYGYEQYATIGSWHGGGGGNTGGFAAWHKHGNGCSVSGVVAPFATGGGPESWSCYESYYDETLYESAHWELHTPFSKKYRGSTPNCECYKRGPTSNGKFSTFANSTGCYEYYGWGPYTTFWNNIGLHVPYNQTYYTGGDKGPTPSKVFYHPGYWQPTGVGFDVNAYVGLYEGGELSRTIVLPWPQANYLQGSFASHTTDINKLYAFSPGTPSRFAVSDDCGHNWEERASVPVPTGCYSGFPTSSNKMYAGTHISYNDIFYNDEAHRRLLFASWDRGETWTDVTGDLWTECARLYPDIRYDWVNHRSLGPRGLVTIAPRYSK
jgi:hypothetical protein